MPERYAPLPPSTLVFRTARVGGAFLPAGQVLPLPSLLEPSREDLDEAARSGRRPGLSVWDAGRISHELACWFRGVHVDPSAHRSFRARVDALRGASERYGEVLDVVSDAVEVPGDRPPPADLDAGRLRVAGEGHALLEGIASLDVKGIPKAQRAALRKAYYDRLQIVLDLFAA